MHLRRKMMKPKLWTIAVILSCIYSENVADYNSQRFINPQCLEHNTAHPGGDIGYVKLDSAILCYSRCISTPGCKLFTFRQGICWLKSEDKGRMTDTGVVSGTIQCHQEFQTKLDSCLERYTAHQKGNTGKEVFTSTALSCYQECLSTNDCNFFRWTKINNKCWLKSEDKGAVKSFEILSGNRSCAFGKNSDGTDALTEICLEQNIAHHYGDIIGHRGVQTAIDCHALCLATENCLLFSWTEDSKACWLKKEDTGAKMATGKISGMRNCPKDIESRASDCLIPDTAYPYGNLREVKNVDSSISCFQLCMDIPECKLFTWTSSTKACWLKNELKDTEAVNGAISGFRECITG